MNKIQITPEEKQLAGKIKEASQKLNQLIDLAFQLKLTVGIGSMKEYSPGVDMLHITVGKGWGESEVKL